MKRSESLFWVFPHIPGWKSWHYLTQAIFFFHSEIEKFEGDELRKDGEVKKYLDIISNKNIKLSERVLIPVQQYPKVRPQRSMQHAKERWRAGQINVIVMWRSERIKSNSSVLWDCCARGNDLICSVSGRSKLDGVRLWFVLHCRSAAIYTLHFCPEKTPGSFRVTGTPHLFLPVQTLFCLIS